MANFEYKNIDEIVVSTAPIRGTRINLSDNKLLEKRPVQFILDPPDPKLYNFEFHTFLPNTAYISTVYNLESWSVKDDNLTLDIHRDLRKANNIPGVYKVVYNFLKNVVGGFNDPVKLFISDISSDRSELKVSLINPESSVGKEQLKKFVLNYIKPSEYIPTFVLNFGENKISNIINVTSDGTSHSFYVKLYEPLAADLDIFFECWIAEEFMRPYIETVTYVGEEVDIQVNKLRGPNFEVDYDYWITTETEYKSWNDILSANVQTSQEILDRYITSNNLPVELNVNFREFENFVFYSSAEDRIENFVYKMELIERYNTELGLLEIITGSVASNKVKIKGLRDKVISGFDSFEKWLYYETTGSNYYTSQASSSIVPYPKYEATSTDYDIATKEGTYKFYTSTSSEVNDWYTDVIQKASNFDLKNYNSLNKAIPEYLRDDPDNDQFVTFVNMIGHHFDVIYLYTDHMVKKNLREEHPKDGMSQDLIYEVAKNLGWTLSSGTQAKDLWEYALGVSGSGEPIWTGKVTTNKYLAKTEEERTKEVWRRIVNNLPYIYKSKGTARGITALLAAYGIPQTLLTIREYGGPDNADLGIKARAEWEKHTYYLNFLGSNYSPVVQNKIEIPWERVQNETGSWQYIDTLTFRWKMEPSTLYSYQSDANQTLLQKNSSSRVDWFVTVNKNGTDDDKGSLTFYIGDGTTYSSASIEDEYMYDDVPLNLMIQRSVRTDVTSSDQQYSIYLKTAKYGKLAVERSASIFITGSTGGDYNRAWASDGVLYIGSGSNQQTSNMLSGSIFELRYWTQPLNQTSFDNHVLASRAYNGNTETSSFYDLQAQFKFWQKFDVAVTTSISSSHPDQTQTSFYTSPKVATFYNFTSESFESIVETYNMEVATLGNNTIYSEKVRIDSSSLVGGLSKDFRNEVSAFDKYSIDSDKLMVAFSPQHVINEDIYEALGGVTLDDYIGTYGNIYENQYSELKWLARQYWKKYPNKNDYTAYIRLIAQFDFSVFDQIRQTLPARVNPILGIVVEPNILERNKIAGVGKDFGGDTLNVFDFNEISSSKKINVDPIVQKTGTIVIDWDQDGEVQDIVDDIDIETILPVDFKPKSASITDFNPFPTADVSTKSASIIYDRPTAELDVLQKQTTIIYDRPTTVLDVSQNYTEINDTRPETILQLTQYTSSLLQKTPVPDLSYVPYDATITDVFERVELEYSEKTASLVSNQPIPRISYNPYESSITDVKTIVDVEYMHTTSSIDLATEFIRGEFKQLNAKMDYQAIGVLNTNYSSITTNLSNSKTTNIVRSVGGTYNTIDNAGNISIDPTTTYERDIIYKTTSSVDLGYGSGWNVRPNDAIKASSVFLMVSSSRSDGFYNRAYLFYSSSRQLAAKTPTSSSFIRGDYQTQNSLATATRRQRFEGTKAVSPDINVNSNDTIDGSPVVEVYLVDSKEIIYRTYDDGGNLSAI